jgi:hypothetical protein
MLKLCNYGIVLAKVSCMIFEIVLAYFIVCEAYFVGGEFSITIRVASVYLLFMLTIGMSGVLRYWSY